MTNKIQLPSETPNAAVERDRREVQSRWVAAFLVVVALFVIVSTKVGTRGMGFLMIAGALKQQFDGRIEYGWEGRPSSGYIIGWPAAVINLIIGLAGLAVVVWPEVAMGVFGWNQK